ncbi:MAG: GNAT family N-acetyltransferase [Gemmatimonadales bacterium]
MPTVERFRPDDRTAVDELFRRVFGDASAESNRQRWEWQYLRNPHSPGGEAPIWLLREGDAIVGQLATIPVKISVNGAEINGSWAADMMIAPEQQRRGLGEILLRTWDRNAGAAVALSMTDASHALVTKRGWSDLGKIPRLVRTPKAAARRGRLASLVRAIVRELVARFRPLDGEIRRVARFDAGITRLWDRVAPRFAFAVRRDAPYLNWKFVDAPHATYSIATLVRGAETAGYVVYRQVRQDQRRIIMLVDFLADPADPAALRALLSWLDREADAAGAEAIRVFSSHADFRETFHESGYVSRRPTLRFIGKINAVPVPPTFFDSLDGWHVTMGDSDVDR